MTPIAHVNKISKVAQFHLNVDLSDAQAQVPFVGMKVFVSADNGRTGEERKITRVSEPLSVPAGNGIPAFLSFDCEAIGPTKPLYTITEEGKDGEIKIYGNNHRRQFEFWRDLPEGDKDELRYVDDPDANVFHYRGSVYAVEDFEAIRPYAPAWLRKFDGIINDSFFSGVLIKLDPDEPCDYYRVYTFIS